MFNFDKYPSRPKILFIGNATSSHVQSWINLLNKSEFNIRLFSVSEGYPDSDWETKVYLTTRYPPENLNKNTRMSWHPVPEEWYEHDIRIEKAKINEKSREDLISTHLQWEKEVLEIDKKYLCDVFEFFGKISTWKDKYAVQSSNFELIEEFENIYENLSKSQTESIKNLLKKFGYMTFKWNSNLDFFSILSQFKNKLHNNLIVYKSFIENFPQIPGIPVYPIRPVPYPSSFFPIQSPEPKTRTTSEWLAQIIKDWRPDIIHTFGIESGCEFYYEVRKKYNLERYGKWVLKVFGGSDLEFNIHKIEKAQQIKNMFSECDEVIFDNQFHTNLVIKKALLQPQKVSKLSPLPGSGGIDVEFVKNQWKQFPSKRKNIVWPKSYETIWSKAVPVILALINIWEKIKPCDIYMLTVNEEIFEWLLLLPSDMKQYVHVYKGVSRMEVIDFMLNSRILIATSLIDGIPNVIYEAMACGTIPIVSPLESIKSIMNEENVMFADNLNQKEIENSIIKLLEDDNLVDRLAYNNLDVVKKYADLPQIQKKVIEHYESLCRIL